MSQDLKSEKSLLRQRFLSVRRGIPADKKAEYDSRICRYIINSVSYKYYDTLLLYAALYDEPDLSALAVKAVADGKRVAYPRCVPHSRDMVFHYVTDLSQLKKGTYGIPEPDASLPAFDPGITSCSVCFIPAVAVDRRGYRIGYGGGYYDRFFSSFSGTLAAVVFSGLIADGVPHGKYDLRADVIFTEGGVIAIDKN